VYRDDEEERAAAKLRLWQRACQHKMEEQDRRSLVRLIDWFLLLPQDRNRALRLQFAEWRKENTMPFVSIFEQEVLDEKQKVLKLEQQLRDNEQQLRDREQEARNNCLSGIALGLKLKFKEAGEALFGEVWKQTDLDLLRRFLDSIEPAASLDDLRKLLP